MDELLNLLEENWQKIKANNSDAVVARLFEFFYNQLLIEDESSFRSTIKEFESGLLDKATASPKLAALVQKYGEAFAYDIFKLVSNFMLAMHELKEENGPFIKDAIKLQLTQLYIGIFTLPTHHDHGVEKPINDRHKKMSLRFHPDRLTSNHHLNWLEEKIGSGECFKILQDSHEIASLDTFVNWQKYLNNHFPQLLSFFKENQSNGSSKKVQQAFKACLIPSLTSRGENGYAVQTQAILIKQCLSSSFGKQLLQNCGITLEFICNEITKQSQLCTNIFDNYSKALKTFFPDLERFIQQIHEKDGETSITNDLILGIENQLFSPLSSALTCEERATSYNLALLKLFFKPNSQYSKSEHISWLAQIIPGHTLVDLLDQYANDITAKKSEKLYTDIKPSNFESYIEEKCRLAATLTEKLFLKALLDIVQNYRKTAHLSEKLLSSKLSAIIPLLTASLSTTVLVTMYANEIALLFTISYLCLRSNSPILQSIGKNIALMTSSGLLYSFGFPLQIIKTLHTTLNFTTTASKQLLLFGAPQQLAITRDKNSGRLNLYSYATPIITTIARPLEEYVRYIQEKQWASSYRVGGVKADKIQVTIDFIREIDSNSEMTLLDKLKSIEQNIVQKLVKNKTIYASTAKEKIDLSLQALIAGKKELALDQLNAITARGLSLIQYQAKPPGKSSKEAFELTKIECTL